MASAAASRAILSGAVIGQTCRGIMLVEQARDRARQHEHAYSHARQHEQERDSDLGVVSTGDLGVISTGRGTSRFHLGGERHISASVRARGSLVVSRQSVDLGDASLARTKRLEAQPPRLRLGWRRLLRVRHIRHLLLCHLLLSVICYSVMLGA